MKILYDNSAYDMQTHGGVSRCMWELCSHMTNDVDYQIGVIETDNVYLQENGFPQRGTLYRNFISRKNFIGKRVLYKFYYNAVYNECKKIDCWPQINRLYSIQLLKKGNYDVFHPTFFDDYFLKYIGKKPFVLTLHDMIPELYPQYYRRDDPQILLKQTLVPKATHIIAVSEQTKMDAMRILNIAEDRISVIYHGVNEKAYIPYKNPQYDFPYILYVGERHLYKNFTQLLLAALPVLKKYKDLRIVCTGKPFSSEERFFFEALGIAHRLQHIFVKDECSLLDLYHNAITFVYPSEYEGFGIPILESYKAGCPVMLSRASCFPEIARDAAIYFKINKDESDFAEKFEELYTLSTNERMNLIEKQYERLKDFSWTKSAKHLVDIYKKIG